MAEASTDGRATIPRDRDHDYTREAADQRRAFVEDHTDAKLEHVSSYSFEPAVTAGNGRADDPLGEAAGHRAVHRQPDPVLPLQLHDR
jgi:hydroxymethylglutaryl-CoA reductase (NADPH)